jgi:zinc transporter
MSKPPIAPTAALAGVPLSYGSGLICGFKLDAAEACDEDWSNAPDARSGPRWLHFNLSDSRAREWLKSRKNLPDAALDLLLDADPRIHLEVLPGGFTAVLGDLYHDFDDDPERLGSVRLYVDASLFLSGRTHPLKSVDVLRRELARNNEPSTTLAVFERLIEQLAASLAQVIAKLTHQVDSAEDRILEGKHSGEGTRLGNLRRLVVRLRRLVGANRTALLSLPATLKGLYDADEREGLRSAIERLEAVGQDLDLVQERARLLQEEIAARVGEATNRNLFVLSIATTTLLPITLITGIWGMNLGGLPLADSPHGFHVVMFVITVAVLLALWLLRRLGAL